MSARWLEDSAKSRRVDGSFPARDRIRAPGRAIDEGVGPTEHVVGFRDWRAIGGRLSSPHFPIWWDQPALGAECRRFRRAEDLLQAPHAAPDPECGCGIHAYYTPTSEFSKIDFRGVSGIVALWGRIELHGDGMRAQHARVEALGLYARWSSRQKSAVKEIATNLAVDLVDLRELGSAASRYGLLQVPAAASLTTKTD